MRFAAVSDIRGNLPALEAVLADVDRRGCEQVVNLGNLVSGPLWSAETAALLMSLRWSTIRGNHDRQLLETSAAAMGASDAYARARLDETQRDWLRTLPAT